ncbi:MAG: radical SAM/SPASM domain-containing protein [Bacteroidota bacterium]
MPLYRRDTFNFLSKLTLAKTWNAAKLVTSFQLTRLLKKPISWGLPMTVSIEPTTACNLRCPECPSGLRQFTRPRGNLKADFFRQLIDDGHNHLMYLIFYFQGEPYINPSFLDMVTYASSKGIYTISSTNGHYLNDVNAKRTIESGLDRLIISVDGTDQETYEQYRKGGKLEVVLQGARNLVKWKKMLGKGPHLIFQMLVVRPNEHQLEDIKALATEIGIDEVKFKTAQLYDYVNGHEMMPTNQKYSRYKLGSNGRYRLKGKLTNECWKLWHACVITWDGLVAPCCFDKDVSHRLGDTKLKRLRDIWRGDQYSIFRRKLLSGRSEIDICTNCTSGCKVWLGAEV